MSDKGGGFSRSHFDRLIWTFTYKSDQSEASPVVHRRTSASGDHKTLYEMMCYQPFLRISGISSVGSGNEKLAANSMWAGLVDAEEHGALKWSKNEVISNTSFRRMEEPTVPCGPS